MRADQKTIDFVTRFVKLNLHQYDLKRLYLIGSRAEGTPRSDSDHDFLAVVGESAKKGISTGRRLHLELLEKLMAESKSSGLGKIDLLISKEDYFNAEKSNFGTFSYAAETKGIILI